MCTPVFVLIICGMTIPVIIPVVCNHYTHVHPHFPLRNLGKKYALDTTKHSNLKQNFPFQDQPTFPLAATSLEMKTCPQFSVPNFVRPDVSLPLWGPATESRCP